MTISPQPLESSHVRCELAGELLRLSGSLRLQVNGWSMLPAVRPGDTVMVRSATSKEVSEGDIVLFGRDRRLFVHRVDNKGADGRIITRGDAMAHTDPPVSEGELLGRISYVVRNGKCINPNRHPRFSDRAVATMVRHSKIAARVVVGIHGLRQTLAV
jgi:signal peptidase I